MVFTIKLCGLKKTFPGRCGGQRDVVIKDGQKELPILICSNMRDVEKCEYGFEATLNSEALSWEEPKNPARTKINIDAFVGEDHR